MKDDKVLNWNCLVGWQSGDCAYSGRAPNGSKSLANIRDEKLDLLLAWKVASGR